MKTLLVHLGAAWFAVRNLRRRYLRTLAISVPLTLAMTIATTAALISDGIRQDGRIAAQHAPDLVIQHVVAGDLVPVHLSHVRTVLKDRVGISDMSPRVWGLVPFPGEGAPGALATIFGVHWSHHAPSDVRGVLVGEWPNQDERGVIVIGSGLAATGHLELGQTIRFHSKGAHSFRIVGILTPNANVSAASSAWVHPEDARTLFGLSSDEATDVAVSLLDPAESPYLAETVLLKLPEHRLVEKSTVVRHFEAIYGQKSAAFSAIWLMLILVTVSLAFAFGMDTQANERREMALLKVLGWSPLLVVECRLFEAALIGIFATVTGFGLGGLWAVLGAPMISGYFLGWAQVYPGFMPPLAMQWSTGFALAMVGTIPLVAAGVIPAWRIGVLSPDDALRG